MFNFPGDNSPKKQKPNTAVDALNKFISKYAPAETKNEAQEFYTTDEISQAIADHTGVRLDASEIYELMTNMGYKYNSFQGLGFNWLLKKED